MQPYQIVPLNPDVESFGCDGESVYVDGQAEKIDFTGGAALGHPLVYYTFTSPDGYVDCGYCGRRFVRARATGQAAA